MLGKRGLGIGAVMATLAAFVGWSGANAQSVIGVPHEWQMNFPPSYGPLMDQVAWLHDLLLIIITVISVFVLVLLVYAMWRFHHTRNPVAGTVTHHTGLEIAWTVVPILILVVIAVPSFRLLYYAEAPPDAALTVKVTGRQWYWTYEYPDQGNFSVDSRMLAEADRAKQKPNQPRLMAVDEEMVIPANTVVRIIGTAADSMHGWTVPGFGIKKTVIPGRLNEGWISARQEGLYFGQCSQICGNGHSYMPIAVRVVSKADFDKWAADKKKAAGIAPPSDVNGIDFAATNPTVTR
jgi:cytochrome c oxidase subunit 2